MAASSPADRCRHIGDAVAARLRADGHTRIGLLGARWVMEEDFYAQRLAAHGISVVVPTADDRELVDRVVFDELTKGVVTEAAQRDFVRVVAELAAQGAEAVVLACTEIEALFRDCAASLPLVDSMDSHAAAIADYLLTGELAATGRVQAPVR